MDTTNVSLCFFTRTVLRLALLSRACSEVEEDDDDEKEEEYA